MALHVHAGGDGPVLGPRGRGELRLHVMRPHTVLDETIKVWSGQTLLLYLDMEGGIYSQLLLFSDNHTDYQYTHIKMTL